MWAAVMTAALAMLTAVILGGRSPVTYPSDLLSTLPEPDPNAPLIVISTSGAEFPLNAARIFADSSTISPGGSSPVSALLPVFDAAGSTALVVTERKNGLAVYGAFTLSDDERRSLMSADLPPRWAACFDSPEIRATDAGGALQIRALNIISPLYIELLGDAAYVADSLYDMEKMRDSAGATGGRPGNTISRWSIGQGWGGHIKLSDGGVLSAMLRPDGFTGPAPRLEAELAWQSSDGADGYGDAAGRVLWRLSGVEDLVGKPFLRSVREHDWSGSGFFIPDPLIASFGINLSSPKDVSAFPSPIRYLSDQFQRLGMKGSEIQSLLSGPIAFSLGGNTQILWFELPGLVLELPGRGSVSKKLIERFWSELFLGAELREVPGYEYGGITDMPFTILAAGNDEETVIGLTEPDVDRNTDVANLLSSETSAIGWMFLDLPRLGMALADMPSINAMLNPDGEDLVDSESTNRLRDAMNNMGRLFMVWERDADGRGMWYY
ncbi:MAG: hypothetical protein LBQ56_07700 [Synergistaceae bacterium]|nr:hypothetical protein [Synergistaceae bacterium]